MSVSTLAKIAAASSVSLWLALSPVLAKFASKETRQVPITRLVRNLEGQRSRMLVSPTDKALVDFRIGRLYSMSYALKTTDAAVEAEIPPGSSGELPFFGYTPDHVQFRVTATKDPKKTQKAKESLSKAISFLEKACFSDAKFLPAQLGLAWCLEQQGNKARALKIYRDVFAKAYESEREAKGGMYNWSITLESAEYLKKLLDPKKDEKELASISDKVGEIEKLPRYITPVLVPLSRETRLDKLVQTKSTQFDLDGLGCKNYSQWLTPAAGWLVYDPFSTGEICSGLQLIGSASFWLFWRNGYEVLATLDDNGDGKLAGRELKGLCIWRDENANAKSEPGEVKPVSHWQIESLATKVDSRTKSALTSKSGVRFRSGQIAPTYDVIFVAR